MRRSLSIIYFSGFLITTLLSSCYSPRYVYSSSTQNIPLLTKKGDISIAGYFATGGGSSASGYAGSLDRNSGLDVHVAYALSDHFAIMINKYNRWEKNNGANDFFVADSSMIKYKRSLTEFACGYFLPSRKGSKSLLFQLFAGMAFGKFKIDDNNNSNGAPFTRFHYSQVSKIFIQPAIIMESHKNFTASLSSRFTMVSYHKIKTDYTSTELKNYLLDDLSSSPVFFWEPAMSYSVAFKKLKGIRFGFQPGFAVLLNRRFVDYRTINIALGIIADNHLFKSGRK